MPLGIHGLRNTVEELTPTVDHLAGAQINCNYLALLLNNVASVESDGDTSGQGTWLRVAPGRRRRAAPNSEAGPASAPADGPTTRAESPLANHLHSNPYPLVGAKGQNGSLHGRQRALHGSGRP